MNKTKRTVSQRNNKKMQKEIKAAQKPLPAETRQYSDELTAKEMLKKYPKKIAKAGIGMLKGLEKRWNATESKKLKKHSKRTNCGKVDEKSPPAHVHAEGSRWVKNLREQNNLQRKSLSRKATKRK